MTSDNERAAGQLFADGLDRLAIRLDPQAIQLLTRYCLELRKWSARVNLVARNTSLRDLIEKHFLDSLLLIPLLDSCGGENLSLLDVGSGAGFPGLVVKIARPGYRTYLLEPRQRRSAFLRHVIRTLALQDIEVLTSRTEELQPGSCNFSIITGRAVADVPRFLGMVAPLCSPETMVICMQGASGRQNLVQGDALAGFSCIGMAKGVLPFSGIPRFQLLFSLAGPKPV